MIRTAIILAAGRGSRLDPGGKAHDFSKPLMRVGGITLLHRTIESCREAGARRILVVTGFRAGLVKAEVERLDRGDLEVVLNEDWQKANGLSLLACQSLVDEPFVLMMSDHIFDVSILRDLLTHELPAKSVALAVDYKIASIFDIDDATKVAVADGRISNISKQLSRYDAIDCGLFACTPAIFAALDKVFRERGDCSLSDGMSLIGQERRFLPFDIGDRWWQDVDTPDMLAHALEQLAVHRRLPAKALDSLERVVDRGSLTVG